MRASDRFSSKSRWNAPSASGSIGIIEAAGAAPGQGGAHGECPSPLRTPPGSMIRERSGNRPSRPVARTSCDRVGRAFFGASVAFSEGKSSPIPAGIGALSASRSGLEDRPW